MHKYKFLLSSDFAHTRHLNAYKPNISSIFLLIQITAQPLIRVQYICGADFVWVKNLRNFRVRQCCTEDHPFSFQCFQGRQYKVRIRFSLHIHHTKSVSLITITFWKEVDRWPIGIVEASLTSLKRAKIKKKQKVKRKNEH